MNIGWELALIAAIVYHVGAINAPDTGSRVMCWLGAIAWVIVCLVLRSAAA